MHKEIALRIGMDLVMAISVLFGWWFMSLLIGVLGLFKFPYFFELILAGFVYDSLFGMGAGLGFMAGYAGTLITAIFSGMIAVMKKSFR